MRCWTSLSLICNSAKYGFCPDTQVTVDRIRMEEYVQQLRQYLKER